MKITTKISFNTDKTAILSQIKDHDSRVIKKIKEACNLELEGNVEFDIWGNPTFTIKIPKSEIIINKIYE